MIRSFYGFLVCAWTNGWATNRDAGDLRCHCVHCDVTVMRQLWCFNPYTYEIGIFRENKVNAMTADVLALYVTMSWPGLTVQDRNVIDLHKEWYLRCLNVPKWYEIYIFMLEYLIVCLRSNKHLKSMKWLKACYPITPITWLRLNSNDIIGCDVGYHSTYC